MTYGGILDTLKAKAQQGVSVKVILDRAKILSWTSLSKNREVGVIVTEATSIAPMVETFEADYAASVAFP